MCTCHPDTDSFLSTYRFFWWEHCGISKCNFLASYTEIRRHLEDPHKSVNTYFSWAMHDVTQSRVNKDPVQSVTSSLTGFQILHCSCSAGNCHLSSTAIPSWTRLIWSDPEGNRHLYSLGVTFKKNTNKLSEKANILLTFPTKYLRETVFSLYIHINQGNISQHT